MALQQGKLSARWSLSSKAAALVITALIHEGSGLTGLDSLVIEGFHLAAVDAADVWLDRPLRKDWASSMTPRSSVPMQKRVKSLHRRFAASFVNNFAM